MGDGVRTIGAGVEDEESRGLSGGSEAERRVVGEGFEGTTDQVMRVEDEPVEVDVGEHGGVLDEVVGYVDVGVVATGKARRGGDGLRDGERPREGDAVQDS